MDTDRRQIMIVIEPAMERGLKHFEWRSVPVAGRLRFPIASLSVAAIPASAG